MKKVSLKGLTLGSYLFQKKQTYWIKFNKKQLLVLLDALSGKQDDNTARMYQALGRLLDDKKRC